MVKTNTPRVRAPRKSTLEMILSDHNRDCLACIRSGNCELQDLSELYGIRKISFEGTKSPTRYDDLSDSIVRDSSKCILCGRCVAACKKQDVNVISFINRGFNTAVGPAYDISMADAPCTYCGQCIIACPVGALHEKEDSERVWAAINDPGKHVVVQVARRSAPRSVRRSACRSAPASPERCSPRCAAWVLTRSTTPISAPT